MKNSIQTLKANFSRRTNFVNKSKINTGLISILILLTNLNQGLAGVPFVGFYPMLSMDKVTIIRPFTTTDGKISFLSERSRQPEQPIVEYREGKGGSSYFNLKNSKGEWNIGDPTITIALDSFATVYGNSLTGKVNSSMITKSLYIDENTPGTTQTVLSAGRHINAKSLNNVDYGYTVYFQDKSITKFQITPGKPENNLTLIKTEINNKDMYYITLEDSAKVKKLSSAKTTLQSDGLSEVPLNTEQFLKPNNGNIVGFKFTLSKENEIVNFTYLSNQREGTNHLILLVRNRKTKKFDTIEYRWEKQGNNNQNHSEAQVTDDGVALISLKQTTRV